MFKLKAMSFALITPLTLLSAPIAADDVIKTETQVTEQPSTETEPRITARYYSADAIQAIPRLKPLTVHEPEYNKILFKLDGYPKNQEIFLEIKRLASDDPKTYEQKVAFSIQDDGVMLIKNSNHRLQTIISSSKGFLPGERVYYRFRTTDGTVDKEMSGIPTPAAIKDHDHKIVLQAEIVSISPTVYRITLPTMNEGEEYLLTSTSVGDTTKAKPKYTKDKPLHYSPAANGNSKGGDAILEIRRHSGDVYTIKLPWGTALESYFQGKKTYSPKP